MNTIHRTKEKPILEVFFAISVRKNQSEIWIATNKKAVFWHFDGFLHTDTAKKDDF